MSTYTYQWRRNGVNISGATGSTYTLQNADAGAVMSCVVSAKRSGGAPGVWTLDQVAEYRVNKLWPGAAETVSAESNNTAAVQGIAPSNTSVPVITGEAVIGATLSSSTGTWTGAPTPTFTYQWQRGTSNISGATNSTYLLTSSDVNNTIRCVVTASNLQGSASATSASTLAVGPQGQTVYSSAGSFSWTAPSNVRKISVVCIGAGGAGDDGNTGDGGGGGGGGGGLVWANDIPVTPGTTYTVVVGAGGTNGNGKNVRAQAGQNSTFTVGAFSMIAGGGDGGGPYSAWPGAYGGLGQWSNLPSGASAQGHWGGDGGAGYDGGGGGGGGAGYNGHGGNGSASISSTTTTPWALGAGGGGGANSPAGTGNNGSGNGGAGQFNTTGGGGGGTALFSNSVSATSGSAGNGLMSPGSKGGNGGFPGGGGGGSWDENTGSASSGGRGAARIIWGFNRQFPSTNVGDV